MHILSNDLKMENARNIKNLEELQQENDSLKASFNNVIAEYKLAQETIQELSSFPSENPDPVLRIDKNGRLLFANEACFSLLTWKLKTGGKAPEFLLNIISEVLKEGIGKTYETEHYQQVFSFSVVPFVKEGYVNIYGHEITDRKKAEDLLKSSEERLKILFDFAPDAYYLNDLKGNFIDGNLAAEKLLGYNKNELIGKSFLELNLLSFKQILTAAKLIIRNSLGQGTGPDEFVLNRKEGSKVVVEIVTHPVKIKDKILVLGIARDITDRKKSEESLKSINERFVLATTASAISVWEHDLITDIIHIDSNFNKIYGIALSTHHIEFDQYIKFIHPDDVDLIKTNVEAAKSDKNINFEFRIIRTDGAIRNINAFGKIVKDSTNNPIKFIGVNIDISDFKNAELALKESREKLLQLNADKDVFISILSHDLKSPFNNLLGLSKLLIEDIRKLDIDEIESLAKHINKTARTTYNLLEDLLKWARMQQGNIPFNPQNLSFGDICKSILEILNPNAKTKNITINYSGKDGINIFADVDMLKSVLRNLVSNAIKFTNTGGTISIKAEQTDLNVTISVLDNGIGITPDVLNKLFDLSQVITTKGTAKETGTGLGLLLCKEFVEKHGGKIWVESQVGKGSEFKFSLPIYAEQAIKMNN